MKISLINPPSLHELQANDPKVFKGKSQGCLPPLGLLYTASAIHKKHTVCVIDCQAHNYSYDETIEILKEICPDVIGITVMTFTLIDTRILIAKIRDAMNTPVIVGGPHPTIYPQESIEGLGADYAVSGESELIINELLDSIPSSRKIWSSEKFVEDLDSLKFPARDLIYNSVYFSMLSKKNPTTSMFSSRGCPFQCTFCDRPALGKKFRAMSYKRVVDEMESCERFGIKSIMFYDDTFTVDKKRVYAICEEIHRREIKMEWDVRARVDTVDYDMLKEMRNAGCRRIHFGIESSSERVRNRLNKNIKDADITAAFKAAKKCGIATLAYFMIGNPSERFWEIQDTIDYALALNADYASFTVLTPFPHTQLYNEARARGYIEGDPWRDYSKNPTLYFKPPVFGEFFSREELESLLNITLKRYYLSPKFIIKQLCGIKSFSQLKTLLRIGLGLLK